jgi:hypothetical protein
MKKNLTAFAAAVTLLVGAATAADKIEIGTWKLDQAGRDGWSVQKIDRYESFRPKSERNR